MQDPLTEQIIGAVIETGFINQFWRKTSSRWN